MVETVSALADGTGSAVSVFQEVVQGGVTVDTGCKVDAVQAMLQLAPSAVTILQEVVLTLIAH